MISSDKLPRDLTDQRDIDFLIYAYFLKGQTVPYSTVAVYDLMIEEHFPHLKEKLICHQQIAASVRCVSVANVFSDGELLQVQTAEGENPVLQTRGAKMFIYADLKQQIVVAL